MNAISSSIEVSEEHTQKPPLSAEKGAMNICDWDKSPSESLHRVTVQLTLFRSDSNGSLRGLAAT